jgi:hypothetical protein
MPFILKQLSNRNILESDGKGGNLTVLSGKAKAASVKAWKDEGTVKKGDPIEGIELTLTLKNRGNVTGQTYEASTKKYIPSNTPVSDTFNATLFIAGNNGLAYLKVLSSIELSKKIGILPDDADKPLIDGFSGILLVGENDLFTDVMNDEFTKSTHIKMFLFDEFEPRDCNLEFAAPTTGYKAATSNQTEKEKLGDRVNFIQAVTMDGSVEQTLFIKLATSDPTIATLKDFLGLIFQ